jgi:hypothetical protein
VAKEVKVEAEVEELSEVAWVGHREAWGPTGYIHQRGCRQPLLYRLFGRMVSNGPQSRANVRTAHGAQVRGQVVSIVQQYNLLVRQRKPTIRPLLQNHLPVK